MEDCKIILSWFLSVFIYLMGGIDIALISFLIAISADYITGLIKACYEGKISSREGIKGLLKKVGYIIVVGICVVVDKLLGNTGMIRTMILYYFVANEGISIIENCAKMGIPIPKWLINKLEQLKNENNEEKSEE